MKKEKIQLTLNFETNVTVLPASVVNYVDKAKKFDLKVLLLLASSDRYREGKYISRLAEALGAEEREIEASVAFWNGTGILNLNTAEAEKPAKKQTKAEVAPRAEKEKPSKLEAQDTSKPEEETGAEPAAEQSDETHSRRVKQSEIPQYSSSELNVLLEKHKGAVDLIDESQRILGKMFLASDIKVLMGLVEYLDLDYDYVLVLMHYCAKHGIKSMRALEKLAVSCLDDGYTEAAVLQKALLARDEREELEYKIRRVFGAAERKPTAREKEHLEAWITKYKFDLDVIEKAYEITINSTSKPSMHYANGILEKWYESGARNLEDVKAILAAREVEKEKKKEKDSSSFDVDDFFDAALKRSYSDKV